MKLSLRAKLILSFFVLITIPILVLGYFSYDMATKSLQETIEAQLESDTKKTSEMVNITLSKIHTVLNLASKTNVLMEALTNNNTDTAFNAFTFLAEIQQENKDLIENLIITDMTGRAILDNTTINSSTDLSDREYVKTALSGKEAVSDVMISRVSNNEIVAVAEPIIRNNQIVGVLIGTVKFDNISKYAAEIKIGQQGYAYMINKEGLLVYHPLAEKVLKENLYNTSNGEFKSHVEKMMAGETNSGFYSYEGVYKFVTYKPAGQWVLAIVANYDEYMAPAIAIKKSTFFIIGVSLLIALALAFVFANRNIIKPILHLQGLMEKAGNGDLTVSAQVTTKDELQQLSDSFNAMIRHQAGIVAEVRNGAKELAASSEEMAASSEQVSSATHQISVSIQEVAMDAQKQNESILQASQALIQLSSLVQLAQNKALVADENSQQTSKTAQYGRSKVEETVKAIEVISLKTNDTANVVQDLNVISNQIGEIIVTINGIAEQTNLLALNAAIEAARAGEHGRGFSVVADEVRKLAEESNKGASEIVALVKEMVKKTENAVQAMSLGKQAVENGVHIVHETDQAFAQIISAMEKTVFEIREIVEITKDEVATSEQVVALIDTVATLTENTTSNTQEVSAAAQEQTAAVETVASSAQESSAMAAALENLVQKFKIANN